MRLARNILLVEDEPTLRRCLAAHLEARGIHVWAAASLHEARLLLEGQDFDALILDIVLPDGDGYRLLELVPPERSLVITAHPDLSRASDYGVKHTLAKPFDLDEASQLLEGVLEEHAGAPAPSH
ncbi:MAG: response regulator [Myxococcota bacterium]|nr:response regulator [Myxococcota bacterium]